MTDSEKKEWLFKESIRIAEENAALQAEREAFEREKRLLERKLDILKMEYRRLAADKVAFERQKLEKQRTIVQNVTYINGTEVLFKGVNSEIALKKRYRDLIKIFHPDNFCGDKDVIQDINKEYDSLRKTYCG